MLEIVDLLKECKISDVVDSYTSPTSGEIVGKGRARFYVAPFERCISKDVFLITNDRVIIYNEMHGFSHITYYGKSGSVVEGWIRSNRIKYAGDIMPK